MYLCIAAITYLLGVIIGTMLCSLPYVPIVGSDWSIVATDYTAILKDDALKTVAMLLPGNLYHQMGPMDAVMGSCFLLFLYLTLMGTVLLATSLLRIKFLGIATNASLLLVGTGFVVLDSSWMWAFPSAHALIWVHFTPYFRVPVCPLWTSWLYFSMGAIIMIVLAILIAKERSFDSILEFD